MKFRQTDFIFTFFLIMFKKTEIRISFVLDYIKVMI